MAVQKDPRQLELDAAPRQVTIVAAPGPLAIKARPASVHNYVPRRTPREVRFVVMHCTDGHEGPSKDDDVAAMFARDDLRPRRSCHYVVDTDSVTQCVEDQSFAWHCGRRGNLYGVGIELCGRARQTRAQWLDDLSLPMLCLAARLVADLCHRHELPVELLRGSQLRAGLRGITTHAEVGVAWKETRHTDPGPHFPMDLFVAAVRATTPA